MGVACVGCLFRWLSECSDSLPCPRCHRNLHDREETKKAPEVMQKLIGGLLVTCTCGSAVVNEKYAAHVNGECSIEASKSDSIEAVLVQPANAPLTPVEVQLQTTLAKRSLAASPDQDIICMKVAR